MKSILIFAIASIMVIFIGCGTSSNGNKSGDQTNATSIKDTSPKAPSTSAAETMGAKAGENLDIINVPDSVPGSKTIPCGMEGSELSDNTRSKDAHLAWLGNPLKNRYDIPKPGDIKTLKVGDLVASDAIKSKFTQGTA